jgi:hypothetical protein
VRKKQKIITMDWVRQKIGISPSASANGSAPAADGRESAAVQRSLERAQEEPASERLSRLASSQRVQVKSMAAKLAAVDRQLKDATARRDTADMTRLVQQSRAVQKDLASLQAKLANTEAQQRTIAAATSNLDQALLLRDGARELESVSNAVEAADVRGAVDKMKSANSRLEEQNRLLAEPIFDSGDGVAAMVREDDVDAEVQRLLAEQADAALLTLPSAAGRAAPATTMSARENSEIKN